VVSPAAVRVRWEDIFRGYDIRGLYPREIDPSTARRLGRALGRALPGPFLLGRDTRRESESFARELEKGLRSQGARVALLGIVPTPEVAFLAGRSKGFGLAVTPSHNAVGYVGLKGFSPSGRLFDREWNGVRDAFRRISLAPRARAHRTGTVPTGSVGRSGSNGAFENEYLAHVTRGLESDLSVVLDTRGGATARAAPEALRRIGARVVELTRGFSPRFFGLSPEPRPETLTALSARIAAVRADLGFAFDGDGDRCVVLDDRGHRVEPEVVALLLHRAFADPRSPIVASVDASRRLERKVRTVRSRVGGRFVTRAMRRYGAEIAVEPSGHYYLRRYGADSDGILTACLVAHALGRQRTRLSGLSRRFGPLHRGTQTADFPGMAEARRAFHRMVASMGKRARTGLDGVTVEFPEGWCLVRRSNTQPSIRFAYEATDSVSLRRLERAAFRIAEIGKSSVAVREPARKAGGEA
jgi:phosphomannomutase